ncbi:MAG: amino acid permease [Candidatus Binatia bacterium]
MSDAARREALIRQDMRDLHALGYAQQLYRRMGGFSNFAISFSIISILTGAIQLFGYGLQFAGPIINTYGWPLVSVFVLCVAASMAELASAYPTAGGLYFWAHRLGGHRWAWITAWFNIIGQVTITAGIDYAAASYIVAAINRIADAGIPADTTATILAMIAIMIPQILINVFGIRLAAALNDFSVWWHIGGVLLIAALLIALGTHARPLGFLFEGVRSVDPAALGATFVLGPFTFDSVMQRLPGLGALYTGGGLGFAFVLGLLQAQWTYTGYDASAHVAEETVMARLNSAWGVFLSVAVSAVVGYALLIILTLHVPDLASTLDPANAPPVLYLAYANLPAVAAHAVAIVIGVAMWLCGLSSITSMSRMWFAFARDGGMPGHTLIRRVHPVWRTPVWAIVITCGLAVLLTVYAALYSVVVAISTTALYLAYAIPIWLNLRNKLRGAGEFTEPARAPWSLGRWGIVLNLIAVAWVAFITVLFSIPPNELAGWSMLGLAGFMAAYWAVDARHRFTGPRPGSEDELHRIEMALR